MLASPSAATAGAALLLLLAGGGADVAARITQLSNSSGRAVRALSLTCQHAWCSPAHSASAMASDVLSSALVAQELSSVKQRLLSGRASAASYAAAPAAAAATAVVLLELPLK